jgi:hypothetical protein
MELEITMLCKISQIKKDKDHRQITQTEPIPLKKIIQYKTEGLLGGGNQQEGEERVNAIKVLYTHV